MTFPGETREDINTDPDEVFAQAFTESHASFLVISGFTGGDGRHYYNVGCNGVFRVFSEDDLARFKREHDIDDGEDAEETVAV